MADTVSRWLLKEIARIHTHDNLGFVVNKIAILQFDSEQFGFFL